MKISTVNIVRVRYAEAARKFHDVRGGPPRPAPPQRGGGRCIGLCPAREVLPLPHAPPHGVPGEGFLTLVVPVARGLRPELLQAERRRGWCEPATSRRRRKAEGMRRPRRSSRRSPRPAVTGSPGPPAPSPRRPRLCMAAEVVAVDAGISTSRRWGRDQPSIPCRVRATAVVICSVRAPRAGTSRRSPCGWRCPVSAGQSRPRRAPASVAAVGDCAPALAAPRPPGASIAAPRQRA
jgi:hypothetical protein